MRLLFFAVSSPEQCLVRIARRVTEGGHDVPEADVRRRFIRGLANLPLYAVACNFWQIFDADLPRPKVVAEGHGAKLNFRSAVPHSRPEIEAWLHRLG